MLTYEYPVRLNADEEAGGWVVTLPDFPEVVTQGETEEEALAAAEDALEEAVANRIVMNLEIPRPSGGEGRRIAIPASMAVKAAFYMAVREEGLTKVQLAATLGVDEREIRRLLDPYHPSKLNRVEELLKRFEKRIVISLRDERESAALKGGPKSGGRSELKWETCLRNIYEIGEVRKIRREGVQTPEQIAV